jgi:DNA topoisomerase-1
MMPLNMSHKLIIVESPTKAKTITKFLGRDYRVLSSFGHIRDLPTKEIGVDVENGFVPTYIVPPNSKSHVTELKKAAKDADEILFASDEDREGEAISWHVAEVLGINPAKAKRITFHEITKSAIEHALANPRSIDQNLVDAQQARRILDRLVGYELSPFLWNKVRRGLSAGRVQSVAMRLVVERERERIAFKIEEYWSIEVVCEKLGMDFPAKLVEVDGKKIAVGGSEGAGEKLEIKTEKEARAIVDAVTGKPLNVIDVVKKEVSKAPPQPFTTSSLQIDANNKLGMSAKQTMTLAQQLYETGRITYMRTDSVNLADKFLDEAQTFLASEFGKEYATGSKKYKTNKKGAQEAHEAIRPTDPATTPESIRADLEPRLWKLYDLIWRRTIASQMPNARVNQVRVDMDVEKHTFRANGSSILFDGYTKIYQATKEKFLPDMKQGDVVNTKSIEPIQHFTEPPARYSDATLVKVLEEYGIGRPSTYAPTISTIIDRGYVERDDNKKLGPTDIAMIVSDLLVAHFPQIVDYTFTAKLEKELDDVAEGELEYGPMLEQFYKPFHQNLIDKNKALTRDDVMPDRILGKDPESGLDIIAKTGRYGAFVQIGPWSKEDQKAKVNKPKSASILKGMNIESITLEEALKCLELPRTLGTTKEGKTLKAAVGRFGPYVTDGKLYASLKEPFDPLSITFDQAEELIALKEISSRPLAELGEDPTTKGAIVVRTGRFGAYVTDGKTNASLGKTIDPLTLTHEEAVEILIKKRAAPVKKFGKRASKKTQAE